MNKRIYKFNIWTIVELSAENESEAWEKLQRHYDPEVYRDFEFELLEWEKET